MTSEGICITGANAYQISAEHQYYSDAAWTNLVGVEMVPGICCPEDERHSEGDIDTNYRIITFYYECGWESDTGVPNCQAYYSGSWHLVACP